MPHLKSIPLSSRELVRQYRERLSKRGGGIVLVTLEPKTMEQLNNLRSHFGHSRRGKYKLIMEAAINLLHDSIFK